MSKYITLNMQLRNMLKELKHLHKLYKDSEAEMESREEAFEKAKDFLETGECSLAELDKIAMDYLYKTDATIALQTDYSDQETYVRDFLESNAKELNIPSTVQVIVSKGEVQFWGNRNLALEKEILGEY